MLPFRISWEYSHRGQPWVATEDHAVPLLGSAAVDTTLPAGNKTRVCTSAIFLVLFLNFATSAALCGQQQHTDSLACCFPVHAATCATSHAQPRICFTYGKRWQQRWHRLQTRTYLYNNATTNCDDHTPSVSVNVTSKVVSTSEGKHQLAQQYIHTHHIFSSYAAHSMHIICAVVYEE